MSHTRLFFVRQGERRERCFYSEILYVEASGCYCYIYRRIGGINPGC